MRATFSGIEVGVALDNGVHTCGVRGPGDESVLLARGEEETTSADLYFEYRDQANGGYDFVRECRLSRRMLSIELSKPLRAYPGITGIDVTLEVDDQTHHVLTEGLVAVFVSCPERLVAA